MNRPLTHSLAVAMLFGVAVRGQDKPAAPATPITAALLRDAKQMQTKSPEAWTKNAEKVTAVYDQHAKKYANWRRQAPPPHPDLAPAGLPAPYLATLWLTPEDRRYTDSLILANALVRNPDKRAIDFAIEQHELERHELLHGKPYYSRHRQDILARVLTKTLPQERAASLIKAQLDHSPKVERSSMLFGLLNRFASELPTDIKKAGCEWLATLPGGPANGDMDTFWMLRFQLGGAHERDAMAKHIAGENLYYCLKPVIENPMPNARLADALRERQKVMTEHERGYLTLHMRRAIAVTDPERALGPFLARINKLWPLVIDKQASREQSDEFYVCMHTLCDINKEHANEMLERFVKDANFSWSNRGGTLQKMILEPASDVEQALAEQLRQWWMESAPQNYRDQLVRMLDYARKN